MKSILFYVQPLFGSGHLKRIIVLAEYLADNGFKVVLVSGGVDPPELNNETIQTVLLPGIRSDSTFTQLYDKNDSPVQKSLFHERESAVIKAIKKFKPELVITEGFPFSRRLFMKEITTLIRTAKTTLSTPVGVVCSVRDVIQPKTTIEREQEVVNIIETWYDDVLVHGDHEFLSLSASFAKIRDIEPKVTYTGYVSPVSEFDTPAKRIPGTILVSAGGGVAGRHLYEVALEAARSGHGKAYQWHLLIGNAVAEKKYQKWQQVKSDNVRLEHNRADFRNLLRRCELSISQCGYNTAVDLIVTATKGIVVPYEINNEQEQLIRAIALEKRGYVRMLREFTLNSDKLLETIRNLKNISTTDDAPISVNGTETFLHYVRQTTGVNCR